MSFEHLNPISKDLLAFAKMQNNNSLGQCIDIYASYENYPDLSNKKIAIIGVQEDRGAIGNKGAGLNIDEVRKELYKLFSGNWPVKVADIGNISQGNTIEDTYFVLKEIATYLLKNKIIPIVIGGGQDLTYPLYRSYDNLEQTVNLIAIDSKFDIGNIDDNLSSQSYLSKIIMNEPNNLFNFCNLGYQTYFNSQDEIDLLESLYFETHRLGEVSSSIQIVEPILRDADIVSVDISSIRNADCPGNNNASPNGLTGTEICTIARYAGISDKVSAFGVFEYNANADKKNQSAQLIAQMIWYFIEGVNFRANDYPFGLKTNYKKYIVPVEDQVLNFYKSNKSGRWWMEIGIDSNNKSKRHALTPCTYQDYVSACNQEIPDRWIKTLKKMV